MRILLTGGGTGGHVYPALSVAEQLGQADLLFVGSADGPEARIIPAAGYAFQAIPTRKLSRRPSLQAVGAVGVCAWGVVRALRLVAQWKPAAVLGTGGFASAGVMFAAELLRVPTVVHEANAVPGRANRLLARCATRVALTYAATARWFPPAKTCVTGLPVRTRIGEATPDGARREFRLAPDRLTLVVTGGSGGARTLNRAVCAAVPHLVAQCGDRLQVVLQTGRAQHAAVLEEYPSRPEWLHVTPYVEDMPSLLAAADVVVCRAGSSTLAEVTAAGLPAILVPYPYAVGDHQAHNARAVTEAGAALLLPDADCTGERLAATLAHLLEDAGRLDDMRRASRALARPGAAAAVAALLQEIARV